MVWKTKKVKSFSALNNKNLHPSYNIFYGLCSCGEEYAAETTTKVSVCYDEHSKPSIKSKTAAHLEKRNDLCFTWKISSNAPSNIRTRKNIEVFSITIIRPILNEKIDSDALILFRNGVT